MKAYCSTCMCVTTMPMDTTKTVPVEANVLNKRHNTCFIKGVSIKLCCLSGIKQQWRPYFALNENRSLGYWKLLQLLCQRSTHNEGCAPLLKLWTVSHTPYSSYYHVCSVPNSCTAYKASNCNVIPQHLQSSVSKKTDTLYFSYTYVPKHHNAKISSNR